MKKRTVILSLFLIFFSTLLLSFPDSTFSKDISTNRFDFFDLFKTISAIGGFALGLFNLIFLLYKEFFMKAKLNCEIEKSDIITDNRVIYLFNIVFVIKVYKKDIFLKNVELIFSHHTIQSEESRYKGTNKIEYNEFYKYVDYNILDNYNNFISDNKSKIIPIRDLKIDKDSQRTFNLIGKISCVELPDGFDDLPLNNVTLCINYNQDKYENTFDFLLLN